MSSLTLRSGLTIADPSGMASRMMVEEWAYYDGVPNGDWDRVEVIDVLVTTSVNAWLNAAVVRTVHRGLAKACDDLLRAIPRDADLLDGGSTTLEKLLSLDARASSSSVGRLSPKEGS